MVDDKGQSSDEIEVPVPKGMEEPEVEATDVSAYEELPPSEIRKLKEILELDKKEIKKLKERNSSLEKEVALLTNNNEKLVKLTEELEKRVRKLTDNIYHSHIYSFQEGGWIDKQSGKKEVLEGPQKSGDPQIINAQLEEILRMMKIYKEEKTLLMRLK